jgi:hypothetical protein
MKIVKTQVERLYVTGIPNLDSITAFIEDFGVGKGRITIRCYSTVWSAAWFGMGSKRIKEFFATAPDGYLLDNLGVTLTESEVNSLLHDQMSSAYEPEEAFGSEEEGFNFPEAEERFKAKSKYLLRVINIVKQVLQQEGGSE